MVKCHPQMLSLNTHECMLYFVIQSRGGGVGGGVGGRGEEGQREGTGVTA